MAIPNALSSSLIPSVSRAVAMGDKKLVRERVASAIRFSCFVAIPSTVGLTVLAGPVNNLLFSGDNTLAIRMTIYGSLAVVFYSVSTVTNAILQGIDKLRLPIFHAVISLVLQDVYKRQVLFFTVVPVILSSAIYNLNSVLDNGILAYNFKTLGQGDEFASIWGVYTGKYHLPVSYTHLFPPPSSVLSQGRSSSSLPASPPTPPLSQPLPLPSFHSRKALLPPS